MKNYLLLLFPDADTAQKVNALRRSFGVDLVDSLPPHLTLKTRFTLHDCSEEQFKEDFLRLPVPQMTGKAANIKLFGDALVATVESESILHWHQKLTELLQGRIATVSDQFEGPRFSPHITLLRDAQHNTIVDLRELDLGSISFDRLGLFELDPSGERAWAREVAIINLA